MEGEGYRSQLPALDDLPGVIAAAHELKSPLVLMRQLSLELGETSDKQRAHKINQQLQLTLDNTLRLVEQLSLAPRLGEGLFETEPVETQAVCRSLISSLEPLAEARTADLSFRAPRRPLVVLANRDLLPALLTNLCDNEINYSPICIRFELKEAQVGNRIVLSVHDDGPQISRRAFDELRRRLGRSAQPLGERPLSSGLGLWIAARYAEAMSGRLTLTRHRVKGLTFSVDLPKSEQLSLL